MSLKGLKVLITAGPTREMWDDVRFISNLSSGQTGTEIAKEALRRDADVTVISGVPGLDTGTAKTVNVVSAVDMYEAVEEHIGRSDIFIAAAAVADFRPVKQSGKIRKDSAEPVIRLERNPDILKWVGNNYPSKIKVGFSLQEEPGSDDGAVKMKEKNCDIMIINGLSNMNNSVKNFTILTPDGRNVYQDVSVSRMAQIIIEQCEILSGKN